MTQRLSSEDHLALLRAVARLHACHRWEDFPLVAAKTVRSLVAAERVGFDHIAPTVPEMWGVADPALAYDYEQRRAFVENLGEHPLVAHYQENRDPSPTKISDFLDKKAWRRTRLYQELFRSLECEDQMAFPISAPDRDFYGLAIYRSERSFSERDRAALELLRPHLRQAFENAQALDRARRQARLQKALETSMGQHQVWIDPSGKITEASRAALERLRALFPEAPPISSGQLPAPLARWLDAAAPPIPPEPFVRERDGVQLTVRFFPDRPKAPARNVSNPAGCLLVEARLAPARRPALRNKGLTEREIQVLERLEEGLTNPQIAARLGIRPLTVKKHVERLVVKLGASSRAGAVGKLRKLERPR